MMCIRYLLGQAAFLKNMVYAPIQEFNSSGEKIYSELHTADWWWDLQKTLPSGSTVVPILCASNQTHLTDFSGDKKAWPIYLTIGNILSKTRNKPALMAMMLLALLPIPPTIGKLKAKNADAYRVRAHVILDIAMERVLSALHEPAANGVELGCADGQLRYCYPVVCGWIADHLEHVTLQHLKNNSCPVCEIDTSGLGELSPEPCKIRDHKTYKAKLKLFEETEDTKHLDWLQARVL